MIELKEVTPDHVKELVRDMRWEDIQELRAQGIQDAKECIQKGVSVSPESWALVLDGTLLCIMGCASFDGRVGIPWMLSTKHLKKHAKGAIPLGIAYVSKWAEQYSSLVNYVHSKNKSAIRWLKWMGFEFTLPPLLLQSGETFLPFRKEKPNV